MSKYAAPRTLPLYLALEGGEEYLEESQLGNKNYCRSVEHVVNRSRNHLLQKSSGRSAGSESQALILNEATRADIFSGFKTRQNNQTG